MFENDVNQYGYLTKDIYSLASLLFENDVNQYGYLTSNSFCTSVCLFENDVNQYGYLTFARRTLYSLRLRMM